MNLTVTCFEIRQSDATNREIEFVDFVVDKTSQGRHRRLNHFASNVAFVDVIGRCFGAIVVSCRSDDIVQLLKTWNENDL